MTLQEYLGDWSKIVNIEQASKIVSKVFKDSNICPKPCNIFKAFELCPLNTLKVVVVNEFPYSEIVNGKPIATGIALANSNDIPKEYYSKQLYILRESVIDSTLPHNSINFDSSLEEWEKQGVLLLNTALTCVQNNPIAHKSLWFPFITHSLLRLSSYYTGIVYVFIGKGAQKIVWCVNKRYNHVFTFNSIEDISSNLWYEVNKILIGQYGEGIKWYQEY